MKKGLSILLFFALPLAIIGQSVPQYLLSKSKTELESEIRDYLERERTDTARMMGSYRYGAIGDRYLALGNVEFALNYYRLLIIGDEFDFAMSKRRNVSKLTAWFLKNGQADSALYYYSLVEKSKPRRYGCGNTIRAVMPDYRYWLMAALDAKGLTDSAIKVFLPYAFGEWTNNEGNEFSTEHLFENDYHCQVIHFINILLKQVCVEELVDDIQSFTKRSNLQMTEHVEDGKSITKISFFLKLGKHRYDYFGWGFYLGEDVDKLLEQYLPYLKNSFIYRYLPELRNGSNSNIHPLVSSAAGL